MKDKIITRAKMGTTPSHEVNSDQEGLGRTLVFFLLVVTLVIAAQFWYDLILEFFKMILNKEPGILGYLIGSIVLSSIFIVLLRYAFRVPIANVI